MKKTKLMAIVVVVVFAMVMLIGCTAKTSEKPATDAAVEQATAEQTAEQTTASGEAKFKVGFLDQSAEVGPVIRMREIIRGVVEAAGGELICDTSNEDSADAQVNACEKLISAGVDGIIMTPMADSILPSIISMCEENQVYLAITFRNIGDEDVKAVVEASPYYAGNCYEDEEVAGYTSMKMAFEKKPDINEVALIALAVGDTTSDARVAGITRACEEKGAKVVAEVRDINQPSDATEAVQNFVAAYPELDCIAVAACYDSASINALPEAVKSTGLTSDKMCIVTATSPADMKTMFDYGYCVAVGGGHLEIDRGSTAVMLVNAIQGNALGTPAHISIPYMYFGSVEEVEDYAVYVEGDIPIWTADEIKENLLISQNPNLKAEDVISYIQKYSLDDLKTRHSGLVK